MKVAPVIFVPFIAALVYMSVNLLAIGYIDEGISVQRTGEDTVHDIVVKNQILPNTDHWPIAYQIIDGQQLSDFRYPPGFAIYMAAAVKAAENWGGSYFFWRLVEDCFSTAGTTVVVMLLMLRLSDSVLVALGAIASLLYNLSFSAGTARDLAMASFLPWFYGGLLLFVGGTSGLLRGRFDWHFGIFSSRYPPILAVHCRNILDS
jgi:hypothetical protein